MRLSKFIAGLAWVNTFALMWVMNYGPPSEDRVLTVWNLLFFVVIACTASSIQAQEKK